MPGSLYSSTARSRCTKADDLLRQRLRPRRARGAAAISSSRARIGEADPVVQAAALHRVVDLARAVASEHDDRRRRAPCTVPSSGMVIWKSDSTSSRKASNGSSARSSSSISSTGGTAARRVDRLQQRALDQEAVARTARAPSVVAARRLRASASADLQHLARVVPFVGGAGEVQALVALQADQRRARASRPASWRSRSCRCRARLRGTAGAAA